LRRSADGVGHSATTAGAVETAAAVEIDKGGLRQLLIDDFHKLLGKASANNAPAFPQLPQRLRSSTFRTREENQKSQTQHLG
jgi:hypothetical protein